MIVEYNIIQLKINHVLIIQLFNAIETCFEQQLFSPIL